MWARTYRPSHAIAPTRASGGAAPATAAPIGARDLPHSSATAPISREGAQWQLAVANDLRWSRCGYLATDASGRPLMPWHLAPAARHTER
jgi:hypothetical protein